MDMKSSKEIIKNILERYNFDVVYSHTEYVYGMISSQNFIDQKNAIDYLYSAAVVGNKAMGVFIDLPQFELNLPTKGECLFITYKLPKRISAPTIFIRKADQLAERLALALKVSSESKLPIVVVITPNADNNYASFSKVNNDLGRVSPYLSPATFQNVLTHNDIESALDNVNEMLSNVFPDKDLNGQTISLNDPKLEFVDYILPNRLHNSFKNIINEPINISSQEVDVLYNFFYNNYGIKLQVNSVENNRGIETEEMLCPGCPFVNIFAKGIDKDVVIFSDVVCAGVKSVFPQINYATIDSYIGLTNGELRVKTIFIGKTSTYRMHYKKYINNANMILLNDTNIRSLSGFTTLKHPKKLKLHKNTLYPYSCNNIKKFSKVKVKFKKCKCFIEGKDCIVTKQTRCPALYVMNDTLQIDPNLCNGCLACKHVCTYGAIS